MRTGKDIAAEIAKLRALKTTVPKKTFFGDDNHKSLDVQIEALEKRMTEKQADARFYVDEADEEYKAGDNHLYHEACSVIRWMNGDVDEDAPSEGWS